MEWTVPAFSFPAKGGPHLPTPEEWKAELTSTQWRNVSGVSGLAFYPNNLVLELGLVTIKIILIVNFFKIND